METCPQPLRQSDEMMCWRCKLRWSVDEDQPTCPRESPQTEIISKKIFEVCIVESRDLIFSVEADSVDEAELIANDMDASEAIRDQFRERTLEWVVEQ